MIASNVPIQQEQYDVEKLSKYLENATHDSTLVRTKALEDICKELQLNHIPHNFLSDQKNVILDIIIKTMKRGTEIIQILVIRLATLIVLQIGYDERFCSTLSNLFSKSLQLTAISPSVNASICTALAFFELVDNEHTGNVFGKMELFRQIFSVPHKEESNLLCAKALEAWGLLLTLCSPKDVCSSIVKNRTMKDLIEMLHTPNVEVRIICGQIICLIIEQGRMYDSTYLQSDIVEVCKVVKVLVNERYGIISKDKRRTQAAKFREILKYLEVQ